MSKLLEELKQYQQEGTQQNSSIEKCNTLLSEAINRIEEYENIIHSIANIDTIFMLPDGSDKEWCDKEALNAIEEIVKPVWDKHCEELDKEIDKEIQELIRHQKE